MPFFDRDLSWLSFNYRVLQEGARENVPLLERVRFLSIYSSNLDEFYRVRMPALLALQKIKDRKADRSKAGTLSPGKVAPPGNEKGISLLEQIETIVNGQLEDFGKILTDRILPELAGHRIHFIYDQPIPEAVRKETGEYFFTQLLAFLQPVHLSLAVDSFFPENDKIYFAVVTDERPVTGGNETTGEGIPAEKAGGDSVTSGDAATGRDAIMGRDAARSIGPAENIYILNIPSDSLSRFYRVTADDTQTILFIDDIIRDHLAFIFPGVNIKGAYSIKITRDAELDLEDEYEGNIAEKIEKKLAKRDAGLATRFLYQPGIPDHVLASLIDSLGLRKASIVAGGRYHNLKDLSGFPADGGSEPLSYPQWPSQQRAYEDTPSLFRVLSEKGDLMLHTPYDSYDPVLQFFNEASIDSSVEEIYLTMYRIARDSRIAHALISASRNGKKVTVFVELKARFDEANNLRWAAQMKAAGVKIIYSIPGLKVHAKVALVKKRQGERIIYYGLLATGNLNENTARFYTDHILLTGNHDLMRELELLFIFLGKGKDPRKAAQTPWPKAHHQQKVAQTPWSIPFRHLLVAQFNLQQKFLSLIDREIENAGKGLPAAITIKLNNLEERVLIDKLYEASRAGVTVALIVRSICCIIPGLPGVSENISVRRIVDRYLEHGRIFIFHNDGKEEIFLGSADWMNRNIYRRIEVVFPLYDEQLKEEIRTIVGLQLADNTAAVTLNSAMDNVPAPTDGSPLRSQETIYQYIIRRRQP